MSFDTNKKFVGMETPQISKVSLVNERDTDLRSQCVQTHIYTNIFDIGSDTTYQEDFESFCTPLWDKVYCWPPSPPGTFVEKHCSEIFQKTYPEYADHLRGHAKRERLVNGTWAQFNESVYDECAKSLQSHLRETEEEKVLVPMVNYMVFFGSVLSLLCLGTSLAVFYKFRCLRCDRVTVHSHLMCCLVIRFILMIIITEPHVIGHSSSYEDVEILCKAILVLFLYFTFASVSWMFIQGLFLNVTLMVGVVTLSTRFHLMIYYIIGWGVPAAFMGAYVVTMVFKNEESCWNGYSEMDEMWILLGPITFELVVNGIFLLNILRVLLKQVRNSNSRQNTSQIKAAAKATAVLFPVLGINNLILLHNPGGDYNKYFVTLNTFFASTQGIFVAIVYCFTDKEVRAAIRRSVERMRSRRAVNIDLDQSNNMHVMSATTILEAFRRRHLTQNVGNNQEVEETV